MRKKQLKQSHPTSDNLDDGFKGTECKDCLFVEYFMREMLPNAINESRTVANAVSADDAVRFVGGALEKFHIYQACRIRVINQRVAIEEIKTAMREECEQTKQVSSSALLTIDWKMKFLEGTLRQSSQKWYGQRGISWHLNVIMYYRWNLDVGKPELVQVTVDQILNNGNKQDGMAVLSMMEALLVKVSVEIPEIMRMTVVSDNTNCYHRKELLLSVPILNAWIKSLKIDRVIHTETQDGKGPCDAHGVISHRHVKNRFLKARDKKTEMNEVATPRVLASAIACKGGIKNNGE